MRVLLLPHRFPPHGRGGVETWAQGLRAGLVSLGVQVTVASRDDREEAGTPFSVREELGERGRTYWISHRHADARTYRETWDDPRMEAALRSVVRAARPDVVHLGHPDGFGVSPSKLARELGVPLVVTLHDPKWFCGRGQMVTAAGAVCATATEERCVRCLGDQLGRGPVQGALGRRFGALRARWAGDVRPVEARRDPGTQARRRWGVRQAALRAVLDGADAVVSPSRFLAQVARDHGIERPLRTISNGVPVPGSAPWPPGPLRLGWFGVPGPRKGLDVLLAAVRTLPRGGWSLAIHGADAAEVAALAPDGLPPEVTVRGPYSARDAAALMGDVHAVVVPSTWPENQPLVALEARSAGRALIGSRIGGLPELIRDGIDGWLVAPGDPSALRRCIAERIAAPEAVFAAASAGVRPPNHRASARAYARLYRDLLGGLVPEFDPRSACPAQ